MIIHRANNLGVEAEEIANIERFCFSTPWTAQQVKACDNNTVFFLAKIDEKTVGYGGMYTVLDEGYVTNIGVLREFRGQGIGKKLVNKLIEYSLEAKLSFLSLEVRESNIPAINLYTSFGFKEVGVRKNFYHNPSENGKIMTRYFNNGTNDNFSG